LIETRTKIKQLVEMLDSNANVESGVKTIIENKLALTGICGIVKDFINVEQDYQTAIVTALGKHTQNIIVEKNIDAEHAVDFLKANRAGKATFLPLDTIRAKGLRPEHEEILQNREGYCGIACDLIKYDPQYDSAIRFLLGNIIIADNLNNAFNLSKLTYQLYKVITLDGELISPGGSITGGYINKNNLLNQLDSKKTLDELNKSYPLINDKFLELRNELEKTIADLNEISSKQSEKKILLSRYEEILRTNENLLLKYESDYQQLAKTNGIKQKEKSK
jgi:chromosome segregation protein